MKWLNWVLVRFSVLGALGTVALAIFVLVNLVAVAMGPEPAVANGLATQAVPEPDPATSTAAPGSDDPAGVLLAATETTNDATADLAAMHPTIDPELIASLEAAFNNAPQRSDADIAEAQARAAAIQAEVDAGMDYQRARYYPLHFAPAIETASNEECLVCHQEILDHQPRSASPAGVSTDSTFAWYQTLDTYEGPQASFHWRHLESDYAKNVMNLECVFCHKGNDPREESPYMVPTRAAGSAPDVPEFTNRKMVNPSETCLLCHGAMPDPIEIMGLGAPWPETRLDMEDEETINGCLVCHGEYGFRTSRHNVSYLNALNIELTAREKSDTCYGCHGGRQWYQISYPYPRHPWPDMDEEVPEWAADRPTQSKPEYQLPPIPVE